MKKALEAAVVAAALALGVFVARQVAARRAAAARPLGDPSVRPGPDLADPGARYEPKPPGGVDALPTLKLTRPPNPSRRPADVPPPAH